MDVYRSKVYRIMGRRTMIVSQIECRLGRLDVKSVLSHVPCLHTPVRFHTSIINNPKVTASSIA